MELFHEMYGCYYTVVGRILNEAGSRGLTRADIDRIVAEQAFSESGLHLIPRLLSGEWDLLREEEGLYRSKLRHGETSLPFTALQKAWIKALLGDPRMRLFLDDERMDALRQALCEVEPLFEAADFHTFDAAADGDDYSDEEYIRSFRLALAGIKEKRSLRAEYENGRGRYAVLHILPQRMIYSAKDDKFRISAVRFDVNPSRAVLLNMARLRGLSESELGTPRGMQMTDAPDPGRCARRSVRMAIYEERNALERCMLQFASYDKQTVWDDAERRYLCEIFYDPMEETELLIRILSFGPVVKVLAPDSFLRQVRERVQMQNQRMINFS